MLRNEIKKMVEFIDPINEIESDHQKQTLDWINSGADIFRIAKPATPPMHLVSYFVVVDEDARKVLLVDHIKAQMWLPAGGHVKINEHPKATVERELEEELNLKADFITEKPIMVTVVDTVGLTVGAGVGHTDVSLWYAVRGDSTVNYIYDESEFNGIHGLTMTICQLTWNHIFHSLLRN